MQRAALRCKELHCVAKSCAALQRAALRCKELRCVATSCAALQRAALRCKGLCFAVLQPRRRSCPLGTTRLKRARTRARHTHSTPQYHVGMRNDGTPHDRRRAVRSAQRLYRCRSAAARHRRGPHVDARSEPTLGPCMGCGPMRAIDLRRDLSAHRAARGSTQTAPAGGRQHSLSARLVLLRRSPLAAQCQTGQCQTGQCRTGQCPTKRSVLPRVRQAALALRVSPRNLRGRRLLALEPGAAQLRAQSRCWPTLLRGVQLSVLQRRYAPFFSAAAANSQQQYRPLRDNLA